MNEISKLHSISTFNFLHPATFHDLHFWLYSITHSSDTFNEQCHVGAVFAYTNSILKVFHTRVCCSKYSWYNCWTEVQNPQKSGWCNISETWNFQSATNANENDTHDVISLYYSNFDQAKQTPMHNSENRFNFVNLGKHPYVIPKTPIRNSQWRYDGG